MRWVKKNKINFILGLVIACITLATPLIAGVTLNIFQPGEIISSAAVNSNFSNLQDQFDTLCLEPGQIRVSAFIQSNQTVDLDTLFSCGDADVNVLFMQSDLFSIEIENITDMNTFHFQATPHGVDNTIVGCSAEPHPSIPERLLVKCKNGNGTGTLVPLYLTIINTPNSK